MKSLFLSSFLVFLISSTVFSQEQKEIRNLNNKIAIQGYDPVTYFTKSKAIKGKKEFSVIIDGAIYYTSSEANKELLKSNPDKYQPQYGGWCSYAMGYDGSYVSINPESFKVTDGKLYLFYKTLFSDTLKKWNEDEAQLKKRADIDWQKKLKN